MAHTSSVPFTRILHSAKLTTAGDGHRLVTVQSTRAKTFKYFTVRHQGSRSRHFITLVSYSVEGKSKYNNYEVKWIRFKVRIFGKKALEAAEMGETKREII